MVHCDFAHSRGMVGSSDIRVGRDYSNYSRKSDKRNECYDEEAEGSRSLRMESVLLIHSLKWADPRGSKISALGNARAAGRLL
jgi:hypothetical protein